MTERTPAPLDAAKIEAWRTIWRNTYSGLVPELQEACKSLERMCDLALKGLAVSSERGAPAESEGPPPADFVCLRATRCKAPCGDRRCHVAPTPNSTHDDDLVAELVRLKQWFEDRRDRPGCTSQAILIGMALDAHKRNSERNSET